MFEFLFKHAAATFLFRRQRATFQAVKIRSAIISALHFEMLYNF